MYDYVPIRYGVPIACFCRVTSYLLWEVQKTNIIICYTFKLIQSYSGRRPPVMTVIVIRVTCKAVSPAEATSREYVQRIDDFY